MADNSDDLTPENLDEFMKAAGEKAAEETLKETWTQFNNIHKAMLFGGFTEAQANSLLVELMWKFMQEGSK
jgi:hypothetical protein